MGLGDSVPGVSGGTIAVITRIYEELISSIRKFDITFMRLICQFKLQDAWRHVNGSFLLILTGCPVSTKGLTPSQLSQGPWPIGLWPWLS